MEYAGRITVEDAMGKRLQLHEFRARRFSKLVRRYVCETGERVRRLDIDNYVDVSTRQRLVRITR